ncbi:MAG: PSD1 and planctomycete cytochrome C domain-containing protein [Verrucomicrobiota bacterium]|nr:PSD1 and planctomycete cytochrome C domain-containing protein [Verrucomicrobiota bacterium]
MDRTLTLLASVFMVAFSTTAAETPVDFSREILPILSNKCFICHGPDSRKEDLLRLDSFEGATSDLGGYRAVDPGDLAKSEIIARIHDADDPMPPEDAEKQLTAAERGLLNRWVLQGGGYTEHWAFVPPTRPTPPSQDHPIDAFIENQFTGDIDFAAEADKPTLARRLALVLTGLPPSPELLQSFLDDGSSNAYDQLVERLLADPRYGEHQARYWLDAVRYGDTHGLHLDNKRGIYPYRDWVVRSLNRNQPLDEFIEWQLAGDLLPEPTMEQRIATGYVRMNPTTAEGGVIPAEFQAKNNFDRTETLGTVFLGMTMLCSRCHTHKYDPIEQTEYYRLLAFFNNTAEGPLDGNKYEYGPTLKVPANQATWAEWTQLESARDRLLAKAGAKPSESLADLAKPEGRLAKLGLQAEAGQLIKQRTDATARFTTTLVARDLAKPRKTRLLDRGEYNLPTGEPLQPDVLKVMNPFPEGAPRNRLGLARWLTSREQPVVSRVLVNRIWQRVFGAGLVRTPEDFGLQGQQPTHPELLDWLAVELHDSGWDLKHMLRLMVNSRTFRQGSALRDGVNDPENKLWARGPHYRLDAEVLRDIALWASGLLDPHMGGEGVKPYQPAGLWKALAHPGSNTKNYVRDNGQRLYRRSLYVYWKRTSPHPMMTLFDAPSRESSCVQRSRTNTPLQALGLLNETQRIEMARMFAERLLKERATDAERLDLLFTLLACREPSATERDACAQLLKTMRERYAAAEKDATKLLETGEVPRDKSLDPTSHAAWTQLSATLLASDLALMMF